METLVIIGYLAISSAIASFVTVIVQTVKEKRSLKLTPNTAQGPLELGKSKAAETKEKKKLKFLSYSTTSFHYADEERIKTFYIDRFPNAKTESLVKEKSIEASGDVKANVPEVIEAAASAKTTSTSTETMKIPEQTFLTMFKVYQKDTIEKGLVKLGIEEIDIELSELDQLKELANKLKQDFGLDIQHLEEYKTKEIVLKKKAAQRTIEYLEGIKGWVLIEGKFLLQEHDGEYKYTYIHPVNEYINDSNKQIVISVFISKSGVKQYMADQYKRLVGHQIEINVYGEIIKTPNLQQGVNDLQIIPLAIYGQQ